MEDGAKRRGVNLVLLLITNIIYMRKDQALMINLNIFGREAVWPLLFYTKVLTSSFLMTFVKTIGAFVYQGIFSTSNDISITTYNR